VVTGRAKFVLGFAAIWIAVICVRLVNLQVVRHEEFATRAAQQHLEVIAHEPPRGTIYDARGRELAVSVPVDSAFAVPREVEDPAATALQISRLLGVDRRTLESRLESAKSFVWVARQLDYEDSQALKELGLQGIHFRQETKRYYPSGALAGQVLGFVGTDDDGLGGLESLYERALEGEHAERAVFRDARRNLVFEPSFGADRALPGVDLKLTIDIGIQNIVERELAAAVQKYRAKAGTALIMDPNSGAILAMASAPTFDPNRFRDAGPGARTIRAVADSYEPGSTFKVITAAAAIEHNLVDPHDVIDCQKGHIRLDRVRINDHKPFDELTFREVIAKSSNVGTIKIGLQVGADRLYEMIRAFGIGERTGIDLPGESPGILRNVDSWHPRSIAYISFGQAVSTTPLQIANVFATIANGGTRYRPFVVSERSERGRIEKVEPEVLGRPVSPSTAKSVERMLELVVSDGTGKGASIPGYRVAGKTGTAQKAIDGAYSPDKFIASFAGFAPARDPRLVCVVVIDEPQGDIHGGSVAAPVFSKIIGASLLYLGEAPHPESLDSWANDPMLVASQGSAPDGVSPQPQPEAVAFERVATAADQIPDLRGLSARRVVARTAELGLPVTLHGSGLVDRQSLQPGSSRDGVAGVEVWLRGGAS